MRVLQFNSFSSNCSVRMKEKYLKNRRRGRGPDDLFTINILFLRLTTLQQISDFYNNSFWVKIIYLRNLIQHSVITHTDNR